MASLLGRRAWKKCPTTAQVTHPLKQKGWTWANFCEDFHDFHVSDSSIIFTGAHRQPCLLQGDTEKVNLQAFTIKSYPTLLLWHTKCYSIASTLMHSKTPNHMAPPNCWKQCVLRRELQSHFCVQLPGSKKLQSGTLEPKLLDITWLHGLTTTLPNHFV